jgi:hypothetical protein
LQLSKKYSSFLRNIIIEASLAENHEIIAANVEGNASDRYFEPFRLACESELPRLMEIALGGIHFLLGEYFCS